MSDCFDHWADAYDRMLDGEEQDYPIGGDYSGPVCRYCGADGLAWRKLPSGKWWLHEYDDNNASTIPHKCKK